MNIEMLKPYIDKMRTLIEDGGEGYIDELYMEKDEKFEENGYYNVYAVTGEGDITIVVGLYWDEIDYAMKVLNEELDNIRKEFEE